MKRLAVLIMALTLLTACNTDPAPGDPCPTPGSVYAHSGGHNSVHLTCNQKGVWSK